MPCTQKKTQPGNTGSARRTKRSAASKADTFQARLGAAPHLVRKPALNLTRSFLTVSGPSPGAPAEQMQGVLDHVPHESFRRPYTMLCASALDPCAFAYASWSMQLQGTPSPPRMHAGRHFRVQLVISCCLGPRISWPRLGPRLSVFETVTLVTAPGQDTEHVGAANWALLQQRG